MTRKYTHCKHCNNELGEWQALNAQACQDIECIKNVNIARNKIINAKKKLRTELLKRNGAF